MRVSAVAVPLRRRAEARSAPRLRAPVPAVAPWVSVMPPSPGWEAAEAARSGLGVLSPAVRSGGAAAVERLTWHGRLPPSRALVPTRFHLVLLPPGVLVPTRQTCSGRCAVRGEIPLRI